MICDCEGCEYEWEETCRLVKLGCFVASTKETNPFSRKHFNILIVDPDGEWVCGWHEGIDW